MKVLYDLAASQPKGNIKFHGGSEYSKIVFYNIVNNRERKNIDVEVFFDVERDIDEDLLNYCRHNNVKFYTINLLKELNDLINTQKYNVVYSALPDEQFCALKFPKDTKFVFTQHGLRGLELFTDKYEIKYSKGIKNKAKVIIKKVFQKKLRKRRYSSIKKVFNITENMHIITCSAHSKNSILWYYPDINEKQISVVASPAKESRYDDNEEQILHKLGIEKKRYLLLVSADRWEKNNYRMILALKQLILNRKKEFNGYKIVVLGNKDGTLYKDIITEDIKSFFIFANYVSKEDLEILYKNAYMFLYPSLNEGYGYPPIEAMKYGTLSVCAADSSITEVCGDAVLYFNPYNIDEMVIRVLQGFDTDVRLQLSDKMKKHYNEVSDIQKNALEKIVDIICSR